MDRVFEAIYAKAKKGYDIEAIRDGLGWLVEHYDRESCEMLRALCAKALKAGKSDGYFELYKLGLLISAPYEFDCYMQYLEIDRKAEERFYLPRRGQMVAYVNALQELAEGTLRELFVSMPPRVGKALADDTPVLTRKGWKNHGDLVVGDEVIGLDGEFKKVIAVHPKCQLDVLMTFTNGEQIQCHENHEWMFHDRAFCKTQLQEAKYYERRTLEYGGEKGHRGHRYVFQLPSRYVKGESKALPLDPYTLGVWLGDGSNNAPRIANAIEDNAIIERIVENGTPIRWKTQHKDTGVWYYGFDMRKNLQALGMCHSRRRLPKHIPDEYLTASLTQRLQLLAGLIDTDGTFIKKENRYQFTTCDIELRDTFISLVSTFGWRVSVTIHKPKVSSSGVVGKKDTFVIGFSPDLTIPCVLERKQNWNYSEQRAIALQSIDRVEPKQGNCITVEGDGMYLAGRTLIPTHNTQLSILFMTWLMGRNPEYANLYCSYSDIITKKFYDGVLEIITDSVTYNYSKIFPQAPLVRTNAQDETVDLQRRKHYPTMTARSVYGTLNGACDVTSRKPDGTLGGILIADDLVSGIEEAMSKDRLISLWAKVDNNMITRAKEASILWIGTRWSVIDPAGIRMEILENDNEFKNHSWRAINIPALNEKDESNFDFKYGVGLSTTLLRQRRASFERNGDMASWLAQYMGEPIERDGAIFSSDELMYYNGTLPDKDPDRIFMAVDPAWGGGDYVAAPICYQYSTGEIYVADVVYDNSDKSVTQPKICRKAREHNVGAMYVEASKTTAAYPEEIDRLLKAEGKRVNIQRSMKNAIGKNKNDRILAAAPEIRQHMIFLESGRRSKEYEQFMQNVFSFKVIGKNKNDDAPDSLQMAITFAFPTVNTKVTVARRAF